MTIINRVGKPSGKRIVKDEEYYNGRILITQFQHTQKNLIMLLKYKDHPSSTSQSQQGDLH